MDDLTRLELIWLQRCAIRQQIILSDFWTAYITNTGEPVNPQLREFYDSKMDVLQDESDTIQQQLDEEL